MTSDIFGLAVLAISGLVWLIRLEAKTIAVERDLLRIESETEKTSVAFQLKVEKLHNDLNDIKIALARIESRMMPQARHEKEN